MLNFNEYTNTIINEELGTFYVCENNIDIPILDGVCFPSGKTVLCNRNNKELEIFESYSDFINKYKNNHLVNTTFLLDTDIKNA